MTPPSECAPALLKTISHAWNSKKRFTMRGGRDLKPLKDHMHGGEDNPDSCIFFAYVCVENVSENYVCDWTRRCKASPLLCLLFPLSSTPKRISLKSVHVMSVFLLFFERDSMVYYVGVWEAENAYI
jgi:hypothetical protein